MHIYLGCQIYFMIFLSMKYYTNKTESYVEFNSYYHLNAGFVIFLVHDTTRYSTANGRTVYK